MVSSRVHIESSLRALCGVMILVSLSTPARGQGKADLLIFDEDDAVGSGYYDASFGTRSGSSMLTLAGSSADKLPINAVHAYTGTQSGLLQWKSAAGGSWSLFVSSPGWAAKDASGYDSLVFYLNGPAAIDTLALPLLALESTTNAKSSSVSLKGFLPRGLDTDSTTWERVSVPLAAFQPYGSFSLSAFKDFWFSQGPSDNLQHTVWFDDVRIIGPADTTTPVAVKNAVTRWGDRSVVLHWEGNPEQSLQ
jgi:hypothetical protein